MSNFLGGSAVECGPSNALKDVGALVERDYGAHRVSTVTLTQLPDLDLAPLASSCRSCLSNI